MTLSLRKTYKITFESCHYMYAYLEGLIPGTKLHETRYIEKKVSRFMMTMGPEEV